jgi:hypothetical protein
MDPKVNCRVQKAHFFSVLSQINPAHTFIFCIFQDYFNIILSGLLNRYGGGIRSGRPGCDSRLEEGICLFSALSKLFLVAPPPTATYPMEMGESYMGVKQAGREADHSPPFDGEAKNNEAVFPLPRIRLHGVVLN